MDEHGVVHVEYAIEAEYTRQLREVVDDGDEAGEIDAVVLDSQREGRDPLRKPRRVAVAVHDEMPHSLQAARHHLGEWTLHVAVDDDERVVGRGVLRGGRACRRRESTWYCTVVVVGTSATLNTLFLDLRVATPPRAVHALTKVFVGVGVVGARHRSVYVQHYFSEILTLSLWHGRPGSKARVSSTGYHPFKSHRYEQISGCFHP